MGCLQQRYVNTTLVKPVPLCLQLNLTNTEPLSLCSKLLTSQAGGQQFNSRSCGTFLDCWPSVWRTESGRGIPKSTWASAWQRCNQSINQSNLLVLQMHIAAYQGRRPAGNSCSLHRCKLTHHMCKWKLCAQRAHCCRLTVEADQSALTEQQWNGCCAMQRLLKLAHDLCQQACLVR